MTMRTILAIILASLLCASGASAQNAAGDFPNRPIRIIVCVPAGGGVDTVTRIVADGLQKRLGQPVIVENRAGAAGNIGAEAVLDRKSTRLNSSHANISYAVFCLKK